jgi:outer membrane protein
VKFFPFVLLLCISFYLQAEEGLKLSLAEAQSAAIDHSERLSIAELQTLIAREKIQEIRGINLPKLSVDGAYNVRNNDAGFVRKNPGYKEYKKQQEYREEQQAEKERQPSGPISKSTSPPKLPEPPKKIKTIATEKEWSAGKVSLVVPVYDFGYVSSLLQSQNSIIEATIHEKTRVQQDLLFAVANNFYRALEGAKIEIVVLESIRALQAQLATAQDLYSVGLVTQNDVLVVEVQLAERQQECIQARHNIDIALCSLGRLMGKQIATAEQLDDVEENVEWKDEVDSILIQADEAHPVLKKIQARTAAAASDLQATKAENYPDINAFLNLHASSDKYLLHKNWVHGGIAIEIPIFDGGIVNSRVAQKRKQISALDLQYAEAEEDIHLQIRKAYLRVDSAFHQIPVAQKSIQLAEDNLFISKDLFQEGLITSDDVLNDESRLAQARSNYYAALYDFYIAKTELDYAAGNIQEQGAQHVG